MVSFPHELIQCAESKGMFNLPPACIPLEVFNLPNNEFLQNLACTLWVPVWFTTASIKDLGRFLFLRFHGVPPLDF